MSWLDYELPNLHLHLHKYCDGFHITHRNDVIFGAFQYECYCTIIVRVHIFSVPRARGPVWVGVCLLWWSVDYDWQLPKDELDVLWVDLYPFIWLKMHNSVTDRMWTCMIQDDHHALCELYLSVAPVRPWCRSVYWGSRIVTSGSSLTSYYRWRIPVPPPDQRANRQSLLPSHHQCLRHSLCSEANLLNLTTLLFWSKMATHVPFQSHRNAPRQPLWREYLGFNPSEYLVMSTKNCTHSSINTCRG